MLCGCARCWDLRSYILSKVFIYHIFREERDGRGDFFLLAYKFRIFNADDEIHFSVRIRRYRIVMSISYLLTFTLTELEF